MSHALAKKMEPFDEEMRLVDAHCHIQFDGTFTRLEALLVQHPEASVGEIGLDGSRKGAHVAHDIQNEVFVAQLHLAKRMKRPVSVHCVRRYGRVLEGLRKANKTHNEGSPVAPWCLLHGYNGPVEMIGQFVRAGAVFSFGLSLTHTPSPKQIAAVRAVPLNALLLETDSPDNRSCTEPADMAAVAKCVAEVRDMSESELKALVWDTSVTFFGIATEHDEV
ncbi:hypothetical protein SARC_07079 [Sphaeroforma arctica JP610]|uniref:TatD DNase n=1 Tax=Sphaeroforma arctica JP610 TaxID=667725 RepID=A0A0L0FVK1_9EUKA|nr:hypothetical protein SARC_07079 [Sphaeroforma arctica JP610]KNC80561.1 hypothetical protein SARC_07079 [Sphaeroforma arctica JP610]|eukprot:XP_014154463.1 hypothetical protein SARC_07079 [Sphaeroforma arctica JP610]